MFSRKVTLPNRVPKATQLFPRFYPMFTSYVYTKYTRPYHLWLPLGIPFWAKVIVIVATYRRVVTLGGFSHSVGFSCFVCLCALFCI